MFVVVFSRNIVLPRKYPTSVPGKSRAASSPDLDLVPSELRKLENGVWRSGLFGYTYYRQGVYDRVSRPRE